MGNTVNITLKDGYDHAHAEETWSASGSETMGHNHVLPEKEDMGTRSAFGWGTMGHDHAQAEGEAGFESVISSRTIK